MDPAEPTHAADQSWRPRLTGPPRSGGPAFPAEQQRRADPPWSQHEPSRAVEPGPLYADLEPSAFLCRAI